MDDTRPRDFLLVGRFRVVVTRVRAERQTALTGIRVSDVGFSLW